MIELKYPVLLEHGMGFRDRKRICYWGRIPKRLEREGVRVFFGGQDSNGSVDDNAAFLAERVRRLAEENGIEKFNVIAHSKGGLEMRRAIAGLGIAPFVASLTTIATPHRGSKTMDFFMKIPRFLMKAGCAVCDLWFRITGDRHPKTYEAVSSFTTTAAETITKHKASFPVCNTTSKRGPL
ncbi:MAG: alpha/beta hydrolase [Clostridia bacterium]|nr:alpha/beta hydrolase [Clostridia bacterium]